MWITLCHNIQHFCNRQQSKMQCNTQLIQYDNIILSRTHIIRTTTQPFMSHLDIYCFRILVNKTTPSQLLDPNPSERLLTQKALQCGFRDISSI